MTPVKIHVPGPPVPKGRPRFARIGRAIQPYSPKETVQYEQRVGWHARQAIMHGAPLTGPITMRIMFSLPVPKSWPKWKRAAAVAGDVLPTSNPDIDNLQKSVLDGLNKILFADDKQITDLIVTKRYGDPPGVWITATEIVVRKAA